MNKNIVILGCPRSGTSLVANLVKSAGYDADMEGTKPLMKPNPDYNPDGYFERIDVVKMNDNLIKDIGKDYNFLNPPSLEEIKIRFFWNTELQTIRDELNSYEKWFIKDSRLSFTLDYLSLNNIHVIKVLRNPTSVKQSMINHYGNLFKHDVVHGPHYVKKIDFETYYNNINECIDWQIFRSGNLHVEIHYEDLIENKLYLLENFLDNNVDKNIIKPEYRKYVL